jgi:hypothetical protein
LACSSELVPDCGNDVWFEVCVPLTSPPCGFETDDPPCGFETDDPLCDPVTAPLVAPACDPVWLCDAEASPCWLAPVEDALGEAPVVELVVEDCGLSPFTSPDCGNVLEAALLLCDVLGDVLGEAALL